MTDPTSLRFGAPATDTERELHRLLGGMCDVTTWHGATFANLGGGVHLMAHDNPKPPGAPVQWHAAIVTDAGEDDDLDDYITERTCADGATLTEAVQAALRLLASAVEAAEARIARFKATNPSVLAHRVRKRATEAAPSATPATTEPAPKVVRLPTADSRRSGEHPAIQGD